MKQSLPGHSTLSTIDRSGAPRHRRQPGAREEFGKKPGRVIMLMPENQDRIREHRLRRRGHGLLDSDGYAARGKPDTGSSKPGQSPLAIRGQGLAPAFVFIAAAGEDYTARWAGFIRHERYEDGRSPRSSNMKLPSLSAITLPVSRFIARAVS